MPKQLVNMSIFEAISKRDILLHHPYESFAPVIDFIYRAANDPDVLAIKQTLYRTTPDSPLAESLVSAAKAGKEVTVLIELRARFDEAANIALASKLQEAGAHVVYGVVGYKTHCKMALVVRRENGKLKRYVHLGTGNYHPRTARAYTDYGLLSANEALGEDVHQVFMQLTSLMRTPALNLLSQSPFNLHERLLALIKRETRNASAGGTGHIIAKLNALVEPEVIRALYEASNAGVYVDLIVRGICCLRPGVPGVSENIRVRSIVGRFLEHSRCLLLPQRRRRGDLLRERGLDGSQLLPPHRADVPDPRRRLQSAPDGGPRHLPRRQQPGLGAPSGRPLCAAARDSRAPNRKPRSSCCCASSPKSPKSRSRRRP